MLESYLVRGLKAGLVAGVAFGLFVAFLANPMIAAAEGIAGGHGHYGGAHADGGGHHAGESGHSHHGETAGILDVVSAPLISVLGGVFWAAVLGVVTFGVAFYFLEPAIPGTGAAKSAVAGAVGFVTVSGAPWLVLPPQPPGVQGSLSVDLRLALYAGMMLAGLAACLLAGYAYTRLRDGGQGRALAGATVPFLLLGGLAVALPANAATASLPAALVAAFRAQVVFGQAMLWTLLAATHAWLHSREVTDEKGVSVDGTVARSPTAD